MAGKIGLLSTLVLTVVVPSRPGQRPASTAVAIPRAVGPAPVHLTFVTVARFTLMPGVALAKPIELLSIERLGDSCWIVGPDASLSALLVLRLGRPAQTVAWSRGHTRGTGFIRRLAVYRDSVFVIDGSTRVMSVLDPELRLVRSVALPGSVDDLVRLPDGRMIAAGLLTTPDGIGFPLHHLDPLGNTLRSFGAPNGTFGPEIMASAFRVLAVRRQGGLWAAHRNEYTIESYDSLLSTSGKIQRNESWFHTWDASTLPREDVAPAPPSITGLAETGDGLWVTFRTSADRRGPAKPGSRRHLAPLSLSTVNAYVKSVVALLDPRDGSVRAQDEAPGVLIPSARTNEWLRGSVVGGRLVLEVVTAMPKYN